MTRTLLLLGVLAAGCGGGGVDYNPTIDPAHFVATVDNPYFPLVAGTTFRYDVLETDEEVTVSVTSQRKMILGIDCIVVHDVATVAGETIEDTWDWYAQDVDGNVWYMGEDTTSTEDGMTSKEGSWEAGVAGAKPGMVIFAGGRIGDIYRQEYLEDEAEDEAEIVSLDASITVPYGSFTGCLKTRDFTKLDPEVVEYKFYCPGVGEVEAETVAGDEHEQLVEVTR